MANSDIISKFITNNVDPSLQTDIFKAYMTRFIDDNFDGSTSLDKYIRDNIEFIKTNFVLSVDVEAQNCVEDSFDLSDFLIDPLARTDRYSVSNIKRVYYEILRPIAEYFKKRLPLIFESTCVLKINHGILSVNSVNELVGSNPTTSSLVQGLGVDFSIIGLSDDDVLALIVNKNIDINFGVVSRGTGVYITLPLISNETIIEKLYVYSLDGTLNNIAYKIL